MSPSSQPGNRPRNVPVKLALLLAGIALASVGFLFLLSAVDRRTQRHEAARAEQWGLKMAQQEQFFRDLSAELRRLAERRATNAAAVKPRTGLRPALVLKESEAYLLEDDGLRRIVAPIDSTPLKTVVVAVAPPPQPVETSSSVPPLPDLRVHVFSWPEKIWLATEEFSGSPEAAPPAGLDTLAVGGTLGLGSPLLEANKPSGSRLQNAAARLDSWLTNHLRTLSSLP
jgi:hypothetical protein